MPSKHKYRAVPTVVDGIRFASKKEASRYQELKILEKARKIHGLELQPKYLLCAWSGNGANRIGDCDLGHYVADFRYQTTDYPSVVVVEDVKGFKTPLYRWKKKHVEAQYGIQIREV